MALYYKIKDSGTPLPGIQAHQIIATPSSSGPSTKYDFSKHVLIELLDDFTPEEELWRALDLTDNECVLHKRLMIDSHRIRCRRAVVICIDAAEAKHLAMRVSQTKIIKRCVCAVVVQELLSDLSLFEKQILNFGDERSQQQLVYVTDLNRCREPSSLATYLKEKFSAFGTVLSVFVAEDKDGYAYPEGVLKFAYLSEAFAAELAYDQLVVGMERLSVTTHHNILLTQCDLRVRLRETLRNSVSLLENNLLNSRKSPILTRQLSENGDSMIVYRQSHGVKNVKPVNAAKNINQTKNMTLKHINATSVVDNLMDNCNMSNKTPILSLSRQEKIMSSKLKDISNSSYLEHSPLKEISVTSSSKIWTPNINCMQEPVSNDDGAHTISGSTSCSFVISNETSSLCSDCNCNACSDRNTTLTSLEPISENVRTLNNLLDSDWIRTQNFKVMTAASCDSNINAVPCERKNLRSLSNKLSLKSQRSDSLSHSNLYSNVKSTCKSPVVRLRRLTALEITRWTNSSCPPARQSSRLISQKLDDSKTVCDLQEALLDFGTLNASDFQAESPLRMWLKHELRYSSNNRVTGGCLENSKKVVYATTKQDILVSVGCSHMTCSSCYPRSTNLLFGFR